MNIHIYYGLALLLGIAGVLWTNLLLSFVEKIPYTLFIRTFYGMAVGALPIFAQIWGSVKVFSLAHMTTKAMREEFIFTWLSIHVVGSIYAFYRNRGRLN
jgi:hypothetical protein